MDDLSDLDQPAALGPYRIVRRLGRGGMGVVYHAEHAETGERVALKTVEITEATPLSSIRREIHALRRVDHPGVVRIVAEGVEGELPWYAMELLEGRTLREHNAEHNADAPAFTRAAGGDLPRALTRMRAVCDALAFVHGMGIVHRDLKPENVFIREDGSPVLVDFGLALRLSGARGRDVLELGERLVGSPAYMAPEQIEGELMDARVDLYALGCMLYEDVTGVVPFVGSVQRVLQQHLHVAPERPSARVEGVPPALDELILKLLQKRPRDRLGYADDVGAALARLGARAVTPGRQARPHLYRPGLAGRTAALAGLEDALERVRPSRGGRVLVGGESGVGKTRFVTEAAFAATRRGLRVVTGECAAVSAADPAVRAAPLHPFRNLLLAVADHCREQGLAETARVLGDRGPVLAVHEPSLGRLLGQEAHAELPVLPAPAARARLNRCLADALAAFADAQPVVLVLDDLQWADESSLSFLQSLDEAYFAATGVLVLGTYRSDEAGAELRALLGAPGVTRVDLGLLDADAVRRMVSDMLAMSAPPAPFLRFLVEQSEGNPFFIAEYLRVAIEERVLYRNDAGEWQVQRSEGQGGGAYDALPLPGELRALVVRRVAGLGAGARALARMAAVLGREVDAGVLAAAARLDDLDNLEAVEELRARQILDVEGRRLTFVHDKLREIIYGEIAEDDRRALHAAAGAAIEARHAGTPELPTFYPSLVHHFATARADDKTLEYLEKAGARALDTGASAEAQGFFRRALDLDDARRTRGDPPLGPLRRASFERRLGRAALNLGHLPEAERFTLAALHRLRGDRAPRRASRLGAVAELAGSLGRQALHRLGPKQPVVVDPGERRRLTEATLAAERLAEIHYFQNDRVRSFAATLQAANLAEGLGPSPELARGYATLGFGFLAVSLGRVADAYLRRARGAAEASADRQAAAWVSFLAGVSALVSARWAEARASLGHARALARDVQDHRHAETCLAALAYIEIMTGRPEDALALYDELHEAARRSDNTQGLLWALGGQAECFTALGRSDEALARYERRRALGNDYRDDRAEQVTHGIVAQLHLLRGDFDRARRVAEGTLGLLEELSPSGFHFIYSYVATAEVLLALWERATAPGERAAHEDRARRACQQMRAYARVFPIGRPHAHRLQGLYDALSGDRARADRAFRRSLAEAERLVMPFEEGLAHHEIGRHHAAGDPARASHLEEARAIFDRLGRRTWVERTERILAGGFG